MASTVPKHVKLSHEGEARDDMHAVSDRFYDTSAVARPPHSSSGVDSSNYANDDHNIRSFTTEDLPTSSTPLMPRTNPRITAASSTSSVVSNDSQRQRRSLMKGFSSFNAESMVKLSSSVVESVRKQFSEDESVRAIRSEWWVLATEDQTLRELQDVLENLNSAFQFSKPGKLSNLATSLLETTRDMVERSITHSEQCHMMFSQCANEQSTLNNYLGKLREAVVPPMEARDEAEEKRNARRVEWAMKRMKQSVSPMVEEMKNSLEELDYLTAECTKLMMRAFTLLHMRAKSADFSGTGVAAGAAGIVAGALVGTAGAIAAPATGGLSLPISVAGKSLFFTGLAALTPSTIFLNRQSLQLMGLSRLLDQLKCHLEILNQKRGEMAEAFAACEDIEINLQQAKEFCQDAIELETPIFESVWSFVDGIDRKVLRLETSSNLFLTSPSVWHYVKEEHALQQYMVADGEDEEEDM